MTDGILVTADGAVFRGRSVGADGVALGEMIFNTSMTGYQEIITDPSYAGQVVVMTSSHQGNYGVTAADAQGVAPAAAGFVMRSMSRRHSNWRAEGSLGAWLRDENVVALSDVDTRRLTRHIRAHGAMPVAVGTGVDEAELAAEAARAPSMTGRELVSSVTTDRPYGAAAQGRRRGRVVAVDLGMKSDIVANLTERGFDVEVVPATFDAADILSSHPDGVFLSNGPGDPEPLEHLVKTVQELLGEVPVFGICLGHQIMGLAIGARTFKLRFGHHGGNHPVRRLDDHKVEITAHNHGFSVDLWSLATGDIPPRGDLVTRNLLPDSVVTPFGTVIPTHQNLNDGTLEGMRFLDLAAFSVQFHPEAAPGPHDATYLFDDFSTLMGIEGSVDAR